MIKFCLSSKLPQFNAPGVALQEVPVLGCFAIPSHSHSPAAPLWSKGAPFHPCVPVTRINPCNFEVLYLLLLKPCNDSALCQMSAESHQDLV